MPMPAKPGETRRSTWLLLGLYFLTFLVAGYLMINAPFVTDDYLFLGSGAETFRQALDESLHYGNGRLLGNLTAMMIVWNRLVMAAEKALVMVAVAALAARLTAGKNRRKETVHFLLAAVLLFGLSAPIFADVLAWTSAFQNYVPPILAMLVCTAVLLREEKSRADRLLSVVLLVLFGAAGQLFMELSSLVNAMVTGALLLYCAVKWRERLAKSVIWFASVVVGSGLMVLIPRVFPASSDLVETYRTLHIRGLHDMIATALENASVTVRGFFGCRVLIVLLCASVLIYTKKQETAFRRKTLLAVCRAGLLISASFGVFYDFLGAKTELKKVFVVYDAVLMLSCFVLFVCLAALFLQMPKCVEKTLLLCGMAAAVLPLVPMMIVRPFGLRCLFLSYCFLSGCVLLVTKLILRQTQPAEYRQAIRGGLCVFAALAVCLSVVFTDIGWMSRQQVAYIEAKVKEHPQQIEAIKLPTDYVRTPCIWALNRVYYNEEQEDITFVFLDFAEWYAHRQAEGWY